MSTAAMPTSDPLFVVRYLDVLVVVLAAPFVILTDAPVLGYAAGAAAWILTRVLGVALERFARRRNDPRAVVGVSFGVLMGRAWVLGITILVVGLTGERSDGLTAALLALVAFTIYLATSLILRPLERNAPRS
jgi:hypothetical protein